MNLSIRTADWTCPSDMGHLHASAELIYSASQDFYDSVSADRDAVLENLIRQLRDVNTELGHSIILTLEGSLGGICVYYPSEEMTTRRLLGVRYLMEARNPRPDILALLRSFKPRVEPIPMPRYMYWGQLGVTHEFRRLGVASMLVAAMEFDVKSRRFEYICGHTRRDNSASLRLQMGRGFARLSEENFEYLALARKMV